jgi:hypothetical protein
MTLKQVSSRCPGVTTTGSIVMVPFIGAIAHRFPPDERTKIEDITFHTESWEHGALPGVAIRVPFRGTVDGALSFEEGVVRRKDVEAAFGVINNHATNLPAIGPFAGAAAPYWWNTPWGTEALWYPSKGIRFEIVSNEVISFTVFEKLCPVLPVVTTNNPKVGGTYVSDPQRLHRQQ